MSERAGEILPLALSVVMLLVCVGIHYEILLVSYRAMQGSRLPHRPRVLVGVLMALVAHLAEIETFTLAWMVLIRAGLQPLSIADPTAADVTYFSIVTYTSLGYGDVVPLGNARILSGIEALAGLVMIAWTASFTFFEMQNNWRLR